MKPSLAALTTIFLLGCVHPPPPRMDAPRTPEERVSDRYSRKAVKSYQVFDSRIEDHVIMLVWLSTGDPFPMLCRKTADGIYPIPQSVFSAAGAERWGIICEPQLRRGSSTVYALTRLELSRADGALFVGEHRLTRSAKPPLLAAPSL